MKRNTKRSILVSNNMRPNPGDERNKRRAELRKKGKEKKKTHTEKIEEKKTQNNNREQAAKKRNWLTWIDKYLLAFCRVEITSKSFRLLFVGSVCKLPFRNTTTESNL